MAKQTDSNPLAISPAKAGQKLGLSTGVIRNMVITGELPAIRVGRRWLIPVQGLEQWLREQMEQQVVGQ